MINVLLPTVSCRLAIPLGDCLTRGNQTVDVVVEDKHHEDNEQEQTNLLGQFSLPNTEGLTHDPLNKEEKQMATVQNRNGKEVKDSQVNTKQRQER